MDNNQSYQTLFGVCIKKFADKMGLFAIWLTPLILHLHSCFNPLSNERKSMFKSGIRVLFEHGFELENS